MYNLYRLPGGDVPCPIKVKKWTAMRGDRTLTADQGTGKRGEKDLSNSPKRVGIDRQLCCNGLIIRYDYQLQQNMRVVSMIALKPTTTNGIPQSINAVVTLKTHYTSHVDNTQK